MKKYTLLNFVSVITLLLVVNACASENGGDALPSGRVTDSLHENDATTVEPVEPVSTEVPPATAALEQVEQTPEPELVDNAQISSDLVATGDSYLAQGDYEAALAAYNSAIEYDPESAVAYNQRGQMHFGASPVSPGQGAMLADFNKAIELDPSYVLARINRSRVLTSMGREEDAIEELSLALTIDSTNAEIYFYRAIAYEQLDDFDQAVQDFTQSILLGNNSFAAYNGRADAQAMLGDYEEAISDYTSTLLLLPSFTNGYISRGVAYFKLGKIDEALNDLSAAIGIDPLYNRAYFERGRIYFEMGNYPQALDDFNMVESIGFNSTSPYIYWGEIEFVRGMTYLALEAFDSAITDFDVAIEYGSYHSGEAYRGRGEAYYHLGEFELALENYNRALQFVESNSIVYLDRGLVYEQLGEIASAVRDYEQFLELETDLELRRFVEARLAEIEN